MGNEATTALFDYLRGQGAPRVLSTRMLARQVDMAPATFARHVARATRMGLLRPVRAGLFLNALALPAVALAEATPFVRSGAVVSLQTVLGDAAVLNNFTPDVTAVLPLEGLNSAAGEVSVRGGRFHFRRLRNALLYAGDIGDRLVPGLTYARATPERALIDWLILGGSARSDLCAAPAHDLDLDGLDEARLWRLARATGMEAGLDALYQAVARATEHAESYPRF